MMAEQEPHPPGPSEHLSWRELACHDERHTAYPDEWRSTRLVNLANAFEEIRTACGNRPLGIRSAYRTAAYNEQLQAQGLKAADHSQHVEGRALDLTPPEGWTAHELFVVVRSLASRPGSKIGGIGLYSTFVHVDVRPRPAPDRVAFWDYRGQDATRVA